jgi:hypothetical protein
MVRVDICRPRFGSHDASWEPIASLSVNGAEIELHDPDHVVDRELSVIDPDGGRTIRLEDDPEGWARHLPSTYRGPELLAVVVSDSQPRATDEGAGGSRAWVDVPVTAPHLV